jgi:general secretion pathway protein J
MNVVRRTETGFTLIEVLIATTLLAVMMLLLTGSLRIGAASWDQGEERIQKASRMAVVQNFLRAHIASLLPVVSVSDTGQTSLAFHGSRDTLEYVAPLPEQVKLGGLYRFQLYLAQQGDRHDLRVAVIPYVGVRPGGKAETVEPLDDLALVENVKDFRVAYFARPLAPGAIQPGAFQPKQNEWQEEWQMNQLPGLIRIEIEPEGEEPWPPLIVALRAQTLR